MNYLKKSGKLKIVVFKDLFIGDLVWQHIGLTVLSTIILTGLALGFAFKIFNKEKVLFRT